MIELRPSPSPSSCSRWPAHSPECQAIIIISMQPQSTVSTPLQWRLWHGLNFLNGAICFLFGSALLFPHLKRYLPASVISAWLYSIGSFTFLLADITECLFYADRSCQFLRFVANFFLNVIGSAIYLVGSMCFLPQINRLDLGYTCFISASAFIVVAQAWKLLRLFCLSQKGVKDTFREDPSGVLVDLLTGIGSQGYLWGSVIAYQIAAHPNKAYWTAGLFTTGGTFFLLAAICMQKRYFCQRPAPKQNEFQADELE